MSTEDDESDERGTADDSVNAAEETPADPPANVEEETTTDESVSADEASTTDESVSADEASTTDESVSADEASTADDDPVSGHWLYIGIGLLTAVVAWLLIPLFGIGPIYAGYKLYDSEDRTITAGIFVVLGVLPLAFWLLFLVQTL